MSAALALAYKHEPEPERQETAAFVLSLRGRGVLDRDVLRAMETVPRETFAPRRFADLARSDIALPLACGQTMTSPATVAAMLAALRVEAGDRVLEIGTGSGYVTALLARMGARVRSFERKEVLAEAAAYRLGALGLGGSVELVIRDGLDGGDGDARYDRILLNGVVAQISPALTTRLAGNGRLVGAAALHGAAQLLTIAREAGGELVRTVGVPLRIPSLVQPGIAGDRPRRKGSLT